MTTEATNEGQVPAQGATETTTAPAQTSEPSTEQMVKDVMDFDPFGPATPAKAGQEPQPANNEPGGESSGEKPKDQPEPKAAATTAPAPTQQAPLTPREQELLGQVNALRSMIEASQKSADKPAEKPAEAAPKYNLGLPPELIKGLRSEDEQEFAVSMHAVVNGISNKLWNDMQEHLSKVVIPQIDQRATAVQQHSSQVKQIYDEFYGKFPHLNNPVILPMVQQAAAQVARNWQAQGKPVVWSPAFADDVAALVHSVIPAPAAQQQQQQKPAPVKQPFVAQPGARPNSAASTTEFSDVLSVR